MSIFPLSEEMKECNELCSKCKRNDTSQTIEECVVLLQQKELDLREKVIMKLAETLAEYMNHEDIINFKPEQIIQQATKEI